jgi:tetratricopeptide (TPR) repeat protein
LQTLTLQEAIQVSTSPTPNAPQAQLQPGRALRAAGDLTAALSHFQALVQEHPNFLPAWLELGRTHRQQHQRADALAAFRQAEQCQPDHLQTQLEIAIELRDQGQQADAETILLTLQARQPQNIHVLFHLARTYQQQKQFDRADELYQQVLTHQPDHLWAAIHRAQILRQQGEFTAAQAQLETSLAQRPTAWQLLINLGDLAQHQHRFDQALAYFEQAHVAHPQILEPQLRIADMLRQLQRWEAARDRLQSLREKYPEDLRVVMQLGHLARQQGQREQALHWFRQMQADSDNPNQRLNAQLCAIEELRELNQLETALTEVRALLVEQPDQIRAQLILATLLQKQHQLAAATEVYQQVLDQEPDHPHARIALVDVLHHLGDLDRAQACLEVAQSQAGQDVRILLRLAQRAQADEQFDQAQQYLETACQQFPHHPQPVCDLAEVQVRQGQWQAAFNGLETAQAQLPDRVDLPLKLATLKLRFGLPEESVALLQTALARFPHHIPLRLQLARTHLTQGDYAAAQQCLDEMVTDHSPWLKQIAQLRGELAWRQFQLPLAQTYFQQALAIPPATPQNHIQLANVTLLQGDVETTTRHLHAGTAEVLQRQPQPSRALHPPAIPRKSHAATLLNEYLINPPVLAQLQQALQHSEADRLSALAGVLAQAPFYLGSAIQLARELQCQGVFTALRQQVAHSPVAATAIPRRIVQFWDGPTLPVEVEPLCQSWQQFHPDYEYLRFSWRTAARFIRHHYEPDVLKAFQLCDHPARQADFFRLAYLYKQGGFYADIDDRCRQPLETLIPPQADLVVVLEDLACFSNNFLGCVPGQPIIGSALYQAVNNLLSYSAEWVWAQTGPGLITRAFCSGLLPYIGQADYRLWPRIAVFCWEELRPVVWPHVPLAYKRTAKSWSYLAYHTRKAHPHPRHAP